MPQLVTKCVATTGPAGAAAGSAGGFVQPGRLTAVEVDYAAGQPATTDLTVTVGGRTVLTLANQATDRVVNPRVPVQDAAGADIAGRGEETPFVSADLTVAVAQANPGTTATEHCVFGSQ